MGTCLSQEEHGEEAFKFTQFANHDNAEEEPRKPRQCTDMFFFYFMITFSVIVSGLLIYCGSIGNISRITHGYDNCGNVCGELNNKFDGDNNPCIGLDMTKKPFILALQKSKIIEYITYYYDDRKCLDNCQKYGYDEFYGRCVPKDGSNDLQTKKSVWHMLSEDVNACSIELLYMSMISFGLVALMVLLLRYNTEAFIWSVLIGGCLAMILAVVFLWVAFSRTDDIHEQSTLMSMGITMSIFTVVICIYMCFIRKRIKMVIQLFKEASKAIGAVPLILVEPLLTILAFLVSVVVFIYLIVVIGSAGTLTKIFDDHYDYLPTDVVIAAGILFVAAVVWFLYFFIGCQHMIIGGTIASWYFIRDKSRLRSPIYHSTYNLVRYHLGTIAFGSLIMLIMQIVKMIIEGMKRKMRENGCGILFTCFGCFFNILEDFIQYFSKLSYIMTAMHGVSFCRGGKEAMRLLINNGLKVIVVNTTSSFVMFIINLIVLIATGLIGYQLMNKPGLNSVWLPVLIAAVNASLMTYCLLTVYSTAIDTIFLCFCEDTEQNDGIAKPYFMSQELMHFVENSKKLLWEANPNGQEEQNRTQAIHAPAPA